MGLMAHRPSTRFVGRFYLISIGYDSFLFDKYPIITDEAISSWGLRGRFLINRAESLQARATHAQPLKPQLLMSLCCASYLFYTGNPSFLNSINSVSENLSITKSILFLSFFL